MSESGPATDRANEAVVDPTRNVRDLVSAENRRQDDLRDVESRHLRETVEMSVENMQHRLTATQYVEGLRAEHAREMRRAEAARIDAIRAVDVQAVQQAAQVQDTKATALAGQVAASAEAMRVQVASAATAAATALATALAPITTSIEQLRQAMYEAQGNKQQVVDTRDRRLAGSNVWMAIFAGGALIIGFFMFVMAAVTLAALVTHGFTK